MKTIKKIIAIFLCVLVASTTASAQNRNLRRDKVPMEVAVGGHALVDGINGGGFDLSIDKDFPVSDVVALGIGGMVSVDYNKEFGCMTDLLAKANFCLGKSWGIKASGLFGAGDMSFKDISTNGEGTVATYTNVALRPVVGGELELFLKIKKVRISAYGRYLRYFNRSGDRTYYEADGFIHEPTTYNLDKVAVGGKVAFLIGGATEKNGGKGRQVSGDNQWNITGFTGSSFGENKGFLIGTELFHNYRFAAHWQRILGFGTQQIFSEGNSFNEIYGKFGLLWMPWGAEKSPVLFNFGLKAGLGEFQKGEQGSTETGSYAMNSRVQVPGIFGRGCVGISVPFGKYRQWHLDANVEAGYGTCFGTAFNSKSSNYQGTTSGKGRFDASWNLGLQFSF